MGQWHQQLKSGFILLMVGLIFFGFSFSKFSQIEVAKADPTQSQYLEGTAYPYDVSNFYNHLPSGLTKKMIDTLVYTNFTFGNSLGFCNQAYDAIYMGVEELTSTPWPSYLNSFEELNTDLAANAAVDKIKSDINDLTDDAIGIKEYSYIIYFAQDRFFLNESSYNCTGFNIDLDPSNDYTIPVATGSGGVYPNMTSFWSDFSSMDGVIEKYRKNFTQSDKGKLSDDIKNLYNGTSGSPGLLQTDTQYESAAAASAVANKAGPCGNSDSVLDVIKLSRSMCALTVFFANLSNDFLFTSALALNKTAGPIIPGVSSGTPGNVSSYLYDLNGNPVVPIFDLTSLIGTEITAPVESQLVQTGTSGFGDLVVTAYNSILRVVDFLLLVIFLLLGLANILQIEMNNYSIKKILPGLIIGFICAQFSMFGIRILLEVTSALTRGVIGIVTTQNGDAKNPLTNNQNMGENFLKSFSGFPFGANGIYSCPGSPNDASSSTDISLSIFTTDCLPGSPISTVKLFKQDVADLFILVGAIFLGILAFYFILRNFIFFGLVPLAPIAFLGLFFPPLKMVWDRWWKFLSGWLFMPLAAGFWLALTVVWFRATASTSGVASLLGYFFGIVALYLAIKTPFSMAGEAGTLLNKMNTIGGTPFKAAGKFVGDEAKRRVSLSRFGEMGRTVQGWRENRKADLDAAKDGVDLRAARKAEAAEKKKDEMGQEMEWAKKRRDDLLKKQKLTNAETVELNKLNADIGKFTGDIKSLDKTFKKFSSGNEKRAQNKLMREQTKAIFAGGNDYVKSHAQANLSDSDITKSRLASKYREGNIFATYQSDINKRNMARADSNGKIAFASAEDVMSKEDKSRLETLEQQKVKGPTLSSAEDAELDQLYDRRKQAEAVRAVRSSTASSSKIYGVVSQKVLSKQEAAGTRAFLRNQYSTKKRSGKDFDEAEAVRHARAFDEMVRDDVSNYSNGNIQRLKSKAMENKILNGTPLPDLNDEEAAKAQQDLSAVLAIYNDLTKTSPNNWSHFKEIGASIQTVFNVSNPFTNVGSEDDVNQALDNFKKGNQYNGLYKTLEEIAKSPGEYFAS